MSHRRDALERTDGGEGAERRPDDPLAQQLPDGPYVPGSAATDVFGDLGVDLSAQDSRRQLLRFCVDWSEQRHHLAGRLGEAVTTSLFHRGWLERRRAYPRAVTLTPTGQQQLSKLVELS